MHTHGRATALPLHCVGVFEVDGKMYCQQYQRPEDAPFHHGFQEVALAGS